jgi:7-keto-8-aminopelargonate synthetase-like enzyme
LTRPEAGLAPAHMAIRADQSMADAVEAGVLMRTVDDVDYRGRYIEVAGKRLLNFGSCSYLALEQRPELKRAAIRAIERFGVQFSYSRAYMQLPLYPELESALEAMTGGYPLVAPTTTLGHIAALPVLVSEGDAVVIDKSAHASLHTAIALLRSIPVHAVSHNRTDVFEEKLAQLERDHRRVWFVLDGLYSMLGDWAPLEQLSSLLANHPKLHLYVDDAHSTSWCGEHGRGYALDHFQDRSRVVVALSLNKAFSAGGGAIVFSSDADRQRVRRCGGPLIFSGPLQPPLLAAALASARLHVAPAFASLQKGLLERIDHTLARAKELRVKFASSDRTPIFFVRCGAAGLAHALVRALEDRGLYVCVSVFPAVPHRRAGIRFTVSLHNTLEDIDLLMETLAEQTARLSVPLSSHPPAHSGVIRAR